MRDDKTKLTPIELPKEETLSPAELYAQKQLLKQRQATERYKKEYFDYYDDVKINHREDW